MAKKVPPCNQGRVVILLSSDLYFQSGIRDFSLHVIKNLTGLSDRWAHRFQTIVDELCSNAIEYGTKPGGDVTVTYHLGETYLDVTVEDDGGGKYPVSADELREIIHRNTKQNKTKTLQLRGRGLASIVCKWADDLEILDRKEGGLSIRARKYFKNAI